MPGRVVLLGATGYTGRLTAAALGRTGVPLALAGRDAARLDGVRRECAATADVLVVDVADPHGLVGTVGPSDVLVTTVGPFARLGIPAARAAAEAGAGYVDSTGEPSFLRRLVEEVAPLAEASGARLLPAFGYDFVPGHLAAVDALEDAGDAAVALRIGYFVRGASGPSGGTLASSLGVALDTGYRWHSARLVPDRTAARVDSYDVAGRHRDAVSVGGSEHLFLPHSYPQLLSIDVHMGWSGRWSRAAQVGIALTRLPGVRPVTRFAVSRLLPAPGRGPSRAQREHARSLAVAEALGSRGELLGRAEVEGPSPYDLTADLLAAAAHALHAGEVRRTGVLGPVEAFGPAGLAALCGDVGLVRVG